MFFSSVSISLGECKDTQEGKVRNSDCADMVAKGYCTLPGTRNYMMRACAKSCGTCGTKQHLIFFIKDA